MISSSPSTSSASAAYGFHCEIKGMGFDQAVAREEADGRLVLAFMDPVAVLQTTRDPEVAVIAREPRMSVTRIALGALSALLLVTSAACQPARQQNSIPASAGGLDGPAGNGARIYFTGASERGTTVTPTGGANVGGGMMGGGMMGGYGQWLTCASCHGPEGRGGTHVMHMWIMTAPDIRYAALRSMPETKGRPRAYDLDDFRKTVEQGRHPDGEEVKADMPRWKMSDADLADLFTFLKALPE